MWRTICQLLVMATYLQADGALPYQIRFENRPSATAPAQRVTFTDTLDPNPDLSTFELTEMAFANQVLSTPPGLNHAANPLPGFLDPNDDSRRDEDSLSYLVKAKAGLPSSIRIENRASIVFDYNDPIKTPLVFNTIDVGAPLSSVTATSGEPNTVDVSWNGLEDLGGAGIAGFDIYVFTDQTNYVRRWLKGTTANSAAFHGQSGLTYCFYGVDRDDVGSVEPAPNLPDTQFTIASKQIVVSAELTNDAIILRWNSTSGKRYKVLKSGGNQRSDLARSRRRHQDRKPCTIHTNSRRYSCPIL